MTSPVDTSAPAWARGYDLEVLRQVAELHREFDAPYALGAFSRVKENAVAEWMESDELVTWGPYDQLQASAQVKRPRVRVPVRDFTGEGRTWITPGSRVVAHPAIANRDGYARLREYLVGAPSAWLEGWIESAITRELAASAALQLKAVKIKASSELVGVWGPPDVPYSVPERADIVTLGRLELDLRALAAAAAEEVAGMAGWADHYSSYNAKHAWSALALQGYMPPGEVGSENILKPAEMSKAWKAEHAGWEGWQLQRTALADQLTRTTELVEALMDELEVNLQRVRLMRLQPGGGELTRHSDITDPEAGTSEGHLARLHVPLITNPDVRFRQWRLDGRQVEANMAAGELWYLDTRKPHKAGNYGTTERIHLVVDAYSSPRLRTAIASSTEAEVAP